LLPFIVKDLFLTLFGVILASLDHRLYWVIVLLDRHLGSFSPKRHILLSVVQALLPVLPATADHRTYHYLLLVALVIAIEEVGMVLLFLFIVDEVLPILVLELLVVALGVVIAKSSRLLDQLPFMILKRLFGM